MCTSGAPPPGRDLGESERLRALDRSLLLDSPVEPGFDRWTMIATRLLKAPISLITLVDDDRQYFKSVCGLVGDLVEKRETPLSLSICRYVVRDEKPFVIADARADPRVRRHPAVVDLGVAAYLGVPVRDEDGYVLGSLCVVDTVPHPWTDQDLETLLELGAGVERQIRANSEHRDHERLRNVLDGHHRVHELIAAEAPLHEVLDALVRGIEAQSDGMWGSVLLYDRLRRRLWHGAAPSLPEAYRIAIDGVVAGPAVGSCGTAAHTAAEVFAQDIKTDPRWSDYRDLAAEHGLRACWSVPVLDASGEVLATFALYYGHPRSPTAGEITLIRNASRLAGIAIQRHRAQERLVALATHDPLTKLPNRVLLRDRLDRMLTGRKRPRAGVAVLFCDVNGLKTVNDSLGHEAGDRVLVTLAERLSGCVRDEDTVARFGGDQFVIAAAGITAAALSGLADRIVHTLGAPIDDAEDGEVCRTVSVTIGIARADAQSSPQDLIRRADAAMHQARGAAVNWAFYEPGQQKLALADLRLHSALHGALEREELTLVYQPIFESVTGRVRAVEALMRWTHPELGRVGPDQFIPIAEKHGLIAAMGDWVLREAARQGAIWNAGTRPTLISVNVSPRQLVDPAFADRVEAIIDEAGLSPGLLGIEITETVLMADDAITLSNLDRLHRLGVRLALDDFGTGYSSLSHLRRLPISVIKIDRSFIDGLATEKDDSAIVSGVIGMAKGLDLIVTAEGVETVAQADALRDLACECMQGYLFARPLPAEEITMLLELQCATGDRAAEVPEFGRVISSPRATLAG